MATPDNLFALFADLQPQARLLVGTVLSVAGGAAVVQLPDGTQVQARGPASVGAKVFVRGGVIEGSAPNLSVVTATV